MGYWHDVGARLRAVWVIGMGWASCCWVGTLHHGAQPRATPCTLLPTGYLCVGYGPPWPECGGCPVRVGGIKKKNHIKTHQKDGWIAPHWHKTPHSGHGHPSREDWHPVGNNAGVVARGCARGESWVGQGEWVWPALSQLSIAKLLQDSHAKAPSGVPRVRWGSGGYHPTWAGAMPRGGAENAPACGQ